MLSIQTKPTLLRKVTSLKWEGTGDGFCGVVIAEAELVLVRIV